MLFSDLQLNEALLKAVAEMGYEKPSPIQEQAIPVVLEGRDLMASAQTGTGKTAGFSLPILHKLAQSQSNTGIKVLILSPTRELAAQIGQDISNYSKYLKIKTAVIFGGVGAAPQVSALRSGVDILVATPGRLLDLYQQKVFSFKSIAFLVLDEADRMLDMGFARDIQKILALLPTKRQNLLFSATFSPDIEKLARQFLINPVSVASSPQNTTAQKVEQVFYKVNKEQKAEITLNLIKKGDFEQVLIFTRTKHGANKLTKYLLQHKISAAAIHGNKSQTARTLALSDFKKGKIKALVATDIAARGLDIPLLPYVVNYEVPNVPESYVHRIGRTARAGAPGTAISLVSSDETPYIKDIQKLLNTTIKLELVPGFEPSSNPITKVVNNFSNGSKTAKSNTARPKRKWENRRR